MKISVLNKKLMLKHLDEILKIEKDTSDLRGIAYGIPWIQDNFLIERDMKWELSTVAFEKGYVAGFIITSCYDGDKAHVHRVAVTTSLPSNEKKRILRSLYLKLDSEANKKELIYRTTSVPIDNISTQKFNLKEGWIEMNKNEIEEFIQQKNLELVVTESNVMLDKFAVNGDPYEFKVFKYLY